MPPVRPASATDPNSKIHNVKYFARRARAGGRPDRACGSGPARRNPAPARGIPEVAAGAYPHRPLHRLAPRTLLSHAPREARAGHGVGGAAQRRPARGAVVADGSKSLYRSHGGGVIGAERINGDKRINGGHSNPVRPVDCTARRFARPGVGAARWLVGWGRIKGGRIKGGEIKGGEIKGDIHIVEL